MRIYILLAFLIALSLHAQPTTKMYCYNQDSTGKITFVPCPVPTICPAAPQAFAANALDSSGNPIFPPNSLGVPQGNGLYIPIVVLNSTAANAAIAINAITSKDSLGVPAWAFYNLSNIPIWFPLKPPSGSPSVP